MEHGGQKKGGQPQEGKRSAIYALWIAVPYFIVSFLWILFSGKLVGLLASDMEALATIESVKGWFFVTITAILLFLYVQRMVKDAIRPQQELDETVRRRTAELEGAAASLLVTMQQKERLLQQTTRQQQFQSAVLKLSQEFFNVPLSRMSAALSTSLKVVGEYLDAQRVAYVGFDGAGERLIATGQWSLDEKELSPEELTALYGALKQGNIRCVIRRGIEFYEPYPLGRNGAPGEEARHFHVNAPVEILGKQRGSVIIVTGQRAGEWTEEDLNILNIFIEMLRNVYLRRSQELEIEQSNKLMRVVLDSTADSICMLDRSGVLFNANSAFASSYKIPVQTVPGRNIKDLLNEETYEKLMIYVHAALETGQRAVLHEQVRGLWIENTIYPVADENGKFSMATLFSADVTQRVQYEQELFRSRQLFKQLLENAPIGIFWRGLDGLYMGANRQMAESFGTEIDSLVGESAGRFMTSEEWALQAQLEKEMFEQRLPRIRVQQNISRVNGESRLFNVQKVPLYNENGEPYGILGVAEDITDQHQKELELMEAKHVANEANAAKSMFLSRMSHEIRTPLNSIIGLTHIAAQAEEGASVKSYIAQIGASSRHLLEIVNDILDISRIEAGKISMHKARFDLAAAIESAVAFLLPRADERRQKVDLYIGEGLPRFVVSDQTRFKQVVMNLLNNAVKFTPEGGSIELSTKALRTMQNGAVVSFSVRDNGVGIEASQLERIFEPFEQGDGTFARTHEGTGLGLPICKSIVDLMGGEISAQSVPGEGSVFTVVLPFEIAPAEEEDIQLAFDELRVLVVDDEPETRAYMHMLLSQYKVRSQLAASGQEAVEAVCAARDEGDPFNVVFLDMRMPGMDGIETAQAIRRACGERTIVIMFSMCEWADIEKSAKEAGVSLFLPKPIFPSKLLDILYEITKGKRTEAAAQKTALPGCLAGKSILVAEDNAVNQLILREMLGGSGAVLTAVYDGRQAVEAFYAAQGAFDAVLMDIQMPGMDGLEATRAIRGLDLARAQTVPIVAMTANVFREDIEKAMLAGMDAHIGKPIDPNDLVGELCRLMG